MNALVSNLYTNGNEFRLGNGDMYIGYYHILNNGTYQTGKTPDVTPTPVPIYIIDSVPVNSIGEILSLYSEDTDYADEFQGTYSALTIKTYKNDIDLPTENVIAEAITPVTIVDQPDIFFRKNVSGVYDPGNEIFIDQNKTIQVAKGKQIILEFTYNSSDLPENIKFEWKDSFDRTVSNELRFLVDTSMIDAESEVYNCTVTDSFGSDVTDDITINVISPDTNPWLLKNILKNGSANDGTAEWETVGSKPEETGKFLAFYETAPFETKDVNGNKNFVRTGYEDGFGAYYYHKLSADWNGNLINQWYPVPEYFDVNNNLGGTVSGEIKDNYFKCGELDFLVREKENDHGGTSKSSKQIIDLTEAADLIDGKVYGIAGLQSILFGWLGGRADQADKCSCEYDFLDENDVVLQSIVDKIENLSWYDRTVYGSYAYTPGSGEIQGYSFTNNNAPNGAFNPKIAYTESWFNPNRNTALYNGAEDANNKYRYIGINYDYNVGTIGYGLRKTVTVNSITYFIHPVIKTVIVGKSGTYKNIPKGTRKIRVIKRYFHEAWIDDIIWGSWKLEGQDRTTYISDAMMTGLNIRLIPNYV